MGQAFSQHLLAVRQMVIDTSTINPALQDSDYVALANPIYRLVAARDGPYVQALNATQIGWTIGSGGGVTVQGTTSNIRRVIEVYYTGASSTATRGTALEYLTRPEYDLERLFDSATQGQARCGHWAKREDQTWDLFIHPGTSGTAQNFAALVEQEKTDLANGTSVVLLSQGAEQLMIQLLALAACGTLKRGPDVTEPIVQAIPDRKSLADWLSSEEQRGNAFAASLAQRLK